METAGLQLDAETGTKLLRQLLDDFIIPEIRRRHSAGAIEIPVDLRAVQIIFLPDERGPEVRINQEVRAFAKVKAKHGVRKKSGEPVFEREIESVREIRLTESESPDCAHITAIRFGEYWTIGFDFQYNKKLSRSHLESAAQFLESARQSLERSHFASFVDNLFSATELSARAIILSLPDAHFREMSTHKNIHRKFCRYTQLGNIDPDLFKAFDRLRNLRNKARYLKGELRIAEGEAHKLLSAAVRLWEEAGERKSVFRILAERPMQKGEWVRLTTDPLR